MEPSLRDFETSLNKIAGVIKTGHNFLIMTHRDPDVDGIGSILALGKALMNEQKHAVLFTEKPVPISSISLRGSNTIIQDKSIFAEEDFDAVMVLDCSEMKRVSGLADYIDKIKPLINIDHHETNILFGDLNLVDTGASSTGELIYKVIKRSGLTIDYDVAENIFAAIQNDTGSFSYENTNAASMKIAAEMMGFGVKPYDLVRKLIRGYTIPGLKLLQSALETLEYYHDGKIGMITVSLEMIEKAGAGADDTEGFVDYPRFVSGVEVAALVQQIGEDDYKFSLRSNSRVNVALLASRFGGGGHVRAAGFTCHGPIDMLKEKFTREAAKSL